MRLKNDSLKESQIQCPRNKLSALSLQLHEEEQDDLKCLITVKYCNKVFMAVLLTVQNQIVRRK